MRWTPRGRNFVLITQTTRSQMEINMSTTTDTRLDDIEALNRTVADLGGRTYDRFADDHAQTENSGECRCGRPFTTPQGLGLHIAATRREADRMMAGEMDRVRMVLRQPGSWLRIAGEGTPTMVTTIHRVEGARIVTGVNAYTERTLAEWLAEGWTVQDCGGRA